MSVVGPLDAVIRDRTIIATIGVGAAGIGLSWNMETWRRHMVSTNRRGVEAVRILRARGDFQKLMRATLNRSLRWGLVGCVLGAFTRPFIFPLIGAKQRTTNKKMEED
jgi:hypothetical protein